jgi:hypothetical protein
MTHGTIHLAVLYPAYIQKILLGIKRIEGRFTKVHCPPHGQIQTGDSILLKESGGPVVARARAANVISYSDVSISQALNIVTEYRDRLCLADDLIEHALKARYVTLICLDEVQAVTPFNVAKKDRRGWVVLSNQLTFSTADNWMAQARTALGESE